MGNEHAVRSAIVRPCHDDHRLIHEKAGALLRCVASNQGFTDANKRTALDLVELLAQRSGCSIVEKDMSVVEAATSVARGDTGCEELVDWFRRMLRKREILTFDFSCKERAPFRIQASGLASRCCL